MRLDKLFWNSFMSGPLLGFGCAVLVSTNAAPWYQENAPGLIRTVGAIFFPIGEALMYFVPIQHLSDSQQVSS